MCRTKEHETKVQMLRAGLSHNVDYTGEFRCGACGEVILIIREGIHFVPIAFQPINSADQCNCGDHKQGELTAGWMCPVHGQQF